MQKEKSKKAKLTAAACALAALAACTTSPIAPGPTQSPSPTWVAPSPAPTPTITGTDSSNFPVKGWPEQYDMMVESQVPQELLALSQIDWCPNYSTMPDADRRHVWAVMLHGISIPESGLDRTDRYKEPGMGTDPVTGQPVYSEGLLQLSYQDTRNYKTPWCEKIDWAADKSLSSTDPAKTIFNPYINLGCGLEIINKLVKNHPSEPVTDAMGRYWSTMRRGKCEARAYLKTHSACGKDPNGC